MITIPLVYRVQFYFTKGLILSSWIKYFIKYSFYDNKTKLIRLNVVFALFINAAQELLAYLLLTIIMFYFKVFLKLNKNCTPFYNRPINSKLNARNIVYLIKLVL